MLCALTAAPSARWRDLMMQHASSWVKALHFHFKLYKYMVVVDTRSG